MNEKKVVNILITEKEIEEKVDEIAQQIRSDYDGNEIIIVCILTGSMIFVSDLVRKIGDSVLVRIEVLPVSVYEGTKRSDKVRVDFDFKTNLMDRHVIVVDDIVDKGDTMDYIVHILNYQKPRSLKVCALLNKPCQRTERLALNIDYLGFSIDNHFVVGYGMDFDQQFRNLPYIGVLS